MVATYDIQYGFEDGLNHAITQAADALANVRFVEEKALIGHFFEQINLDTGMVVFGVDDTMKALEMSAIEKVLLFEEIEMTRYEVKNPATGQTKIWHLTEKQAEKIGVSAILQKPYLIQQLKETIAEALSNAPTA